MADTQTLKGQRRMRLCPRCGGITKQEIEANNGMLEWRRCLHCQALFAELTPTLAIMKDDSHG